MKMGDVGGSGMREQENGSRVLLKVVRASLMMNFIQEYFVNSIKTTSS
jgi:hypothetical protein